LGNAAHPYFTGISSVFSETQGGIIKHSFTEQIINSHTHTRFQEHAKENNL